MSFTPIVAIAVLFPLLQPLWDKGPLTSDLFPMPISQMTDRQIRQQAAWYAGAKDPKFRCTIARELLQSNQHSAVGILEDLLKKETDSTCKTAILKTMNDLLTKKIGTVKEPVVIRKTFQDPDPYTRAAALELWATISPDPDPLIQHLGRETEAIPASAAIRALAGKKLKNGSLDAAYRHLENPPGIQADLLTLIAKTDPNPAQNKFLQNTVKSGDPIRILRVLEGLAENPAEFTSLVRPVKSAKTAALRLALARINPATVGNAVEKEGLLREILNQDSDPGVREAAARSLGKSAGNEATRQALLKALKSKDRLERTAAAEALTALKISGDELKQAGDLLKEPPLRREVLMLLRGRNAAEYLPEIVEIGKGMPVDDPAAVECVKALGDFPTGSEMTAILSRFLDGTQDPELLNAIAETIEKRKLPASFDLLRKIARNTDINAPAIRALTAMRTIGDSAFQPDLISALSQVKTNPEYRAAACWAYSNFKNPSAQGLSALKKLAVNRCIPVPMSPSVYDAEFVRISALCTIMHFARRGDARSRKMLHELLEQFRNVSPRALQENFTNDSMNVYIRQITEYSNGNTPKAEVVPATPPELTVSPLEKK